jgi:uncharacterized protein YecE (DUF72 family)
MRVAVEFRHGDDVFVYFNNDGNANAVRNARTLQAQLCAWRYQPPRYPRGQLELAFAGAWGFFSGSFQG